MTRHLTMLFTLLLCGLVASPTAHPQGDGLVKLNLEQSVVGDAAQSCGDLPTLRTADLHVALTALYHGNDYKALWGDPRRLAWLKAELEQLVDDGLSPEDYAFALGAGSPVHHCDELRISSHYLLALEHLSRGRLAQEDHEPYWQADALPPASAPSLAELAVTGLRDGIAASFEQARPRLPHYRALRAAYTRMDKLATTLPAMPPGPLLRPGMADERVGQLAVLLQQKGFMLELPAAYVSDGIYHGALVAAVRAFQASRGLQADGIIGPQTIRELNIPPARRVQQVRINLERLRWINAQRSEYLLLVNVASGHIELMRGNNSLWQARVQAGRPDRPTPLMVSYIDRITLNPSWTVPPTILRNDILPKIRLDPTYIGAHDMQPVDAHGNPVDPRLIDWNNPGGIMLRQRPGPTNPLGQMVFRLPNPFSIYLHDTPAKQLFQRANRALSSGCVRVEHAEELKAHLVAHLSPAELQRIALQRASGQTHEVALRNGPQVMLAYWTVSADADGRLAFVPDNYNLDPALIAALAIKPLVHPVSSVPSAALPCDPSKVARASF